MDISTRDFFIPNNAVTDITENDYCEVKNIINATAAFARSTYKSVYIIDYYKQNFLYASPNMALLFGKSHEEIIDFGYRIYTELVPEEDLKMLLEINNKGFSKLNEIPAEEKVRYMISYDFRFLNGKKSRMVNHRITPILLDHSGNVWIALCTVALSSSKVSGNIVLQKDGEPDYWSYNLKKHHWDFCKGFTLSEIEKDVLILSAQGLKMEEIASILFKSIDTIKACKRVLFRKFHVGSISEAIAYASNCRLL